MNSSYSSSTYQRTEVLSTSPERLVPLMYEHLLVNLRRGGMFIRKGDIDGKFTSLAKSADIISELLGSLDHEVGGDLSARLAGLYGFWMKEIAIAGRDLDAGRLDRVAEMVASLTETWNEVARSGEDFSREASPSYGSPS